MILLSSVAAATTAVAVIFTLIDFVIISFVVAMVWLTLKEQKETKAQEVQIVEVPETPDGEIVEVSILDEAAAAEVPSAEKKKNSQK